MLESDIEKKMRKLILDRGGLFIKFISPSTRGVPDRIVIKNPGRIIFVELKNTCKKPTPLQVHTHEMLRRMGCEVRVITGMQEAIAFVQEVFSD